MSLINLYHILWLTQTQVYANRDLLRSEYFTCEGASFQGSIGQRSREKGAAWPSPAVQLGTPG